MTMDCATFQERLADFVGQELDAGQQAAMREHMQTCPACRELARGLQGAAAALEAAVPSLEEAQRRSAALAPPVVEHPIQIATSAPSMASAASRPSRRWGALLRLAAVIALAFGGGYLVRDRQAAEPPVKPPTKSNGTQQASPQPAPAYPPSLNPQYANRFEQAARQHPGSPTFSRSLLALAPR